MVACKDRVEECAIAEISAALVLDPAPPFEMRPVEPGWRNLAFLAKARRQAPQLCTSQRAADAAASKADCVSSPSLFLRSFHASVAHIDTGVKIPPSRARETMQDICGVFCLTRHCLTRASGDMTRKPKRVKAETLQFNGRRPTINDVARLARVSKKTVSRIINKSPFVKENTRERVEALIKEIGYTPDPMARGLASKRSFLVGLIYDQPNPQYVIDMQQGILDVIRGSGFELLVHPCRRQAPDFLQNVRNFVERQKLAGVVLPPSVSEDDALIKILQEFDCPYVRIASVPLDEPEHSIVTHDAEGAGRRRSIWPVWATPASLTSPGLTRSARRTSGAQAS